MILSCSGVVFLGTIVFLLSRKCGLKVHHALTCSLFGFFLSSTAIAPSIHAGSQSLAGLLGNLNF